ncbi:DUF11 domain-containing protein [Thalassotalea sp. ND16A]|uniref:DUF11 domain-containing protein n=1 Tax=Thalassotalea sp. ND16A TaxID=1535422 RepID=UPI00051A21F7|nr:DUF11 domain-containing protein [Thalassotalea sp. ND16A]KGJ97153.1 hypothetical protein ND16A_0075 [Thalassotalea sp. ND16A]
MKRNLAIIKITLNLLQKCSRFGCRIFAPFFLLFTLCSFPAFSGTEVELRDELGWAGNGNFVGTAGSFRTSATQCGLTTSATGQLHGIPAGATVAKAHLYWASSGVTPDYTITFSGSSITSEVNAAADRQYTEVIKDYDYPYFSGAADVTALVQSMIGVANGGSYSFTLTDLNIQQPPSLCGYLLMAGWSLIVIYEEPNEPLRLINVFEGFDEFWNESLTLTPKNFRVPANADLPGAGVNRGKHAHITWEGDENRTDVDENLVFEGQALSFSPINPNNNQFNSTIADETLSSTTWQTNVYGVDLDIYDITSLVSADAMQVTTVYKSGEDMVLLSAEVLSILNVNVADLEVIQGVSANPISSRDTSAEIRVVIDNHGPFATAGNLTATVLLPTDLTLNGATTFSSNGWSCTLTIAPSTIECTQSVNYANGSQDYFDVPVSVSASATTNFSVDVSIPGTVDDPYPIVGGEFDNVTSNNSQTFSYTLLSGDLSTSTKFYTDTNAGVAEAGDQIKYTITLTETAGYDVIGVSIVDNIVADLENLNITLLPAGAMDNSTASQVNISNITVPAGAEVIIEYTVDILDATSAGTVITNTATLSSAYMASDVVVTSNFTVIQLTPLTTIKQLYLWGDNTTATNAASSTTRPHLSRNPPTSDNGTISIARNAGSANCLANLAANYCHVWTLDPNLVTDFTVDLVNLELYLDRTGNWRTGNVNMGFALLDDNNNIVAQWNLDGSQGNTWISSSPGLEQFSLVVDTNFNTLDPALDKTLKLLVQNNDVDYAFNLTPYVNGNQISQVQIDTPTVIAVDQINFFSTAYVDGQTSTSGSSASSIEPGNTMYGRAIISDPFGTFDISSVDFILTDSASAVKTPLLSQAQKDNVTVIDLTAAQVMVEFSYDVLLADPQGNWQIQVTANEGSEGTIWDIEFATIPVIIPPELTVTKEVFLFSNPGTPIVQAKIGDLLQYQILIENNSEGDAETVSVSDNISPYSAFIFNSNNSLDDSLICLDCAAAGLTYVEPSYSANDGISYTHPVVITQDGTNNNIDENITNFKLDLTGSFVAGDSIIFTYQVVVK